MINSLLLSNHFNFLHEEAIRRQLFPFTLIREIGELRIGILSVHEKWEVISRGQSLTNHARIPANMIPASDWRKNWELWSTDPSHAPEETYYLLERPWQMPALNGWAIKEDYKLVTEGRISGRVPSQVSVTGEHDLFIEEGAQLEHCFINTKEGPVYIGKNAMIQQGAMLRGPLAICEGAVIKMGAILYGGTTIGMHAVAGGEIKNSILSDFSNKGHHGYIGDSVIGNWCNLGAGTSCSNMKNNAGSVKVWDMANQQFLHAGSKCGLMMGDHSRSAINTSFNTGTVSGICANIFDTIGLTPKFIPSFSWGGGNQDRSEWEKEIQSITNWMKLKGHHPSPERIERIKQIYSTTNP
jgi:UDP-N-acetylglucosamine diphosphorylase/glucosamine-1-phosphate N-acetyltransferase